jgi:hypothetical protein
LPEFLAIRSSFFVERFLRLLERAEVGVDLGCVASDSFSRFCGILRF